MAGTTVRQALVTGISITDGRVVGVTIDGGEIVPGDAVVVAMGPWSGQAAKWLPGVNVPVTGSAAHSIILQPAEPVTAHALFTTFQLHAKSTEPEVTQYHL